MQLKRSLILRKANTLLVDPPWHYGAWKDKETRTADAHYPTMTLKELIELKPVVNELASENCALFMWATFPCLPEALTLMKMWEFDYKTAAFVWHKTTKDGKNHVGLGHYTRANAEPCLLGIRGRPKRFGSAQSSNPRQLSGMKAVEQWITDEPEIVYARVREHSRKPNVQYGKIEALFEGPYVEMFARQKRKGWKAWGNQTEKFE